VHPRRRQLTRTDTEDSGEMWPVGFAIQEWTPAVEKGIAELVAAAVS
jgi:hypothetical protein